MKSKQGNSCDNCIANMPQPTRKATHKKIPGNIDSQCLIKPISLISTDQVANLNSPGH